MQFNMQLCKKYISVIVHPPSPPKKHTVLQEISQRYFRLSHETCLVSFTTTVQHFKTFHLHKKAELRQQSFDYQG